MIRSVSTGAIACLFLVGSAGSCSSPGPERGSANGSANIDRQALSPLPPGPHEELLPAAAPFICVHSNPNGREALFEVIGLHPEQLARLAALDLEAVAWAAILAVYVNYDDDSDRDVPPIVGRYEATNGTLSFAPRFALEPGLVYRVVFSEPALHERVPVGGGAPDRSAERTQRGEVIETTVFIPPPPRLATTVVTSVYPTVDVLPENQLKFYVHFSAPMTQGEAYSHLRLVHQASGQAVDMPFLELEEELWDWEGTRLTAFIDPGRIKREVTPHEELGPVLRAGEAYSLEVDESWPDADGNPLASSFSKAFRVGPPDYEPIDPDAWSIERPPAGTRAALTVRFPEPLDRALLERVVWVADASGEELAGRVEVDGGERPWNFTPEAPWSAGEHRLVALTTLEDLAGNGIGRPFEVDVFQKVRKRLEVKRIEVPFSVAAED